MSKNKGVFSLVQTIVQNALNFDTKAPETNMHHLILLNDHVDGGKEVADLFNPARVIGHRHVFLLDVAQLPSELEFLAVVLAAKTFLRFPQASFGILAS